jgi:hypothetical protein
MHAKFWEDNIRMDLREIVRKCGLDSCGSRKSPVVGSCEHGNEYFKFNKW